MLVLLQLFQLQMHIIPIIGVQLTTLQAMMAVPWQYHSNKSGLFTPSRMPARAKFDAGLKPVFPVWRAGLVSPFKPMQRKKMHVITFSKEFKMTVCRVQTNRHLGASGNN